MIRMKRLFLLASVISTVMLLPYAAWSLISGGSNEAVGKLFLPLRVVPLYAQEPDSQLAIPIRSVKARQVKDTWQAPRSGRRTHQGQDIFAPRGTPVYSATEGYVARIGENRLGGRTVSVVGAGGRVYYYAHLDSYAPGLAEGDCVNRETVLGYVGTTGNARGTPPHLHFGIYTFGGAIDPLPLLTDRPKGQS